MAYLSKQLGFKVLVLNYVFLVLGSKVKDFFFSCSDGLIVCRVWWFSNRVRGG